MHINRRTMRNAYTVVFGSLRMSMTCTRYPYCTFGAQAHEHCEHMYVDCTVEHLGSKIFFPKWTTGRLSTHRKMVTKFLCLE